MDLPPSGNVFADVAPFIGIAIAMLFTIIRAIRLVQRMPQQLRQYSPPREVECINCQKMTLRSEPRCLHCYAPTAPSLERSPTPHMPVTTGLPPMTAAPPQDDREVPPLVKKI